MKYRLFKISLVIIVLWHVKGVAQSVTEPEKMKAKIYLKPGDKCPDFELNNVNDFRLTQVKPKDFKGKWLIIDFWDKNCLSCVESFPKINALQKTYEKDIQILLIGQKDKDGATEKIYSKYKAGINLKIANGFDSCLIKQLDFHIFPRIVIVTPEGIVHAITNSLNDDNIKDLIAGKHPKLNKIYQVGEAKPSRYVLKSLTDNSDSSLNFKSTLHMLKPLMDGDGGQPINPKNGYYEAIAKTKSDLYMLAYLGQYQIDINDSLYARVSDKPLFETKDTLIKTNLQTEPYYAYTLTLPTNMSDRKNVMRIMQNDLKSYFGYEGIIEERFSPYWRLTVNKRGKTKLKTKEIKEINKGRIDTGFVAKNISVKELIKRLVYIDLPVLDDTGIEGNVDVDLPYLLTTIEGIQKSLNENGLFLVKDFKKMKVLVIRDPKQNSTL